jgi:hypothetical protein
MKNLLEPWIPAAFCAFLSAIAPFASIRESGGWWRSVFLALLPICFFFVGGAMWGMQREIREFRLRLCQIAALQLAATVSVQEKP